MPTLEPSTDYPTPYLGGEWHMRQSCDYMVTTSMAVLDLAAERRQEWLYDIYRMGREAIVAHATELPRPGRAVGPWRAVKLVNTLRLGGVEIERAAAPFSVGGKDYSAGTFVIPGGQPFAPYVKDLLTPQVYPALRLIRMARPRALRHHRVDPAYQMGVEVDHVTRSGAGRNRRVGVRNPRRWSRPPPAAFVLDPRANDAFIAVNRLLKAGVPFSARPASTWRRRPLAGRARSSCRANAHGGAPARLSAGCGGVAGIDDVPPAAPAERAPGGRLSRVGRQYGRRLDPLGPRAVRVPLHPAP